MEAIINAAAAGLILGAMMVVAAVAIVFIVNAINKRGKTHGERH